MRRRGFVMLVGTVVVWPLVARAEQRSSLPRIGYLSLRTAANPHFEVTSRASSWRGFAISATSTANRSRSSFDSPAATPNGSRGPPPTSPARTSTSS